MLSPRVIGNEYIGREDVRTWAKAAQHLAAEGRLSAEDARTIRWLDVFGQLIANTDQHFGNLSFFVDDVGRLQLAPVYDMLPMLFAPVETEIIGRAFSPSPPTAATLDVWPSLSSRNGELSLRKGPSLVHLGLPTAGVRLAPAQELTQAAGC
jgi:hypothetical protein